MQQRDCHIEDVLDFVLREATPFHACKSKAQSHSLVDCLVVEIIYSEWALTKYDEVFGVGRKPVFLKQGMVARACKNLVKNVVVALAMRHMGNSALFEERLLNSRGVDCTKLSEL